MPVIGFELRVNESFARHYRKVWSEAEVRRRVAGAASLAVRRVQETLLPVLQVEAPPRDPMTRVRWKSERQRKAVLAHLRRTGNLPYRRTRQMINGWGVRYVAAQGGGSLGAIQVTNDASAVNADGDDVVYYPYVLGAVDYPAAQQPFHADTGWYVLKNVIDDKRRDMQREVGRSIARAAAGGTG